MTSAAKAPNAEPIPGYRLIEPLGSGGFGEVWKCEAPGGLFKAIKFVRGGADDLHHDGGSGAEQELRALQHVKALRHPFLLGLDRVEHVDGELVIVMELADRSLHDLLCECRESGLAGVPRAELLRYFAETAEVLDLMNQEYGLQHLDVKPRNLFVVGRHVKVADFGLVNSLAELSGSTPSALQVGAATPIYAAPESFLGKITQFSDQYSLAIAYHELLVGEPPFVGKNIRQLALQHLQAEPDLGRLPETDRAAVRRALSKEPRSRFPSCAAFVEALQQGTAGETHVGPPPSAPRRPKPVTLSDVPVVDLTATPVAPGLAQAKKDTHPEVARETRDVPNVSSNDRPPIREGRREGPAPPAIRPAPGRDALENCQFLECIARGPTGETWTARTADGRGRLVRLLFGLDFKGDKEAELLARLAALRHEGLEPMEIVGGGDHRIAVVADACPTLAARLQECQAEGLPGVPRAELLARLGEAAATLDALFQTHGVRHLGLNPRQLVLRDGRLRLLHFGLAELIHAPAGQSPAFLNPRYCAPELFNGPPHASSDVYSLAVIYHELLTGAHPFRGLSQRQMTSARQRGQPDLSMAPAPDREALLLALEPDPACRTATCTELIAGLDGAVGRSAASARATHLMPGMDPALSMTPTRRALMRQAINGIVAAAAGDLEVREYHNIRALLHSGRSLEHQFFARIAPGVARLGLDGFRREWRAELLKSNDGGFTYLAPLAGGGWQRLLGLRPALKVHIDAPPPAPGGMTDVLVRIEPVRCGDAAARVLDEMGPQLLGSLRAFLQAMPERRNLARLRFERPVRVSAMLDDQLVGEAVVSQGKDISLRGMGLYMPCQPTSMMLNIQLPGDGADAALEVPACIVRTTPHPDGRFEVGVRFLVDGE